MLSFFKDQVTRILRYQLIRKLVKWFKPLTAYRSPLTKIKSSTPPFGEIELSQRTGQLVIVCLMGRGTPSCVK